MDRKIENSVKAAPIETSVFQQVLATLNHGSTDKEMSNALRDVAAAVKLTRKAGSVTLTIEIKPPDNESGEIVFLRDRIKTNVPEFSRASHIFYMDDDNNLVREDPRQRRMFSDEG